MATTDLATTDLATTGMAPIDEKTRPVTTADVKPEKPKLYKVILLNDHYTRFELVSLILKAVFKLGADRAYHVMMTAHQKGSCMVACYTLEIAETKVGDAMALAERHGAALAFSIEPDA